MNIMESLHEDLLAFLCVSLVSAYPSVLLKTVVINFAVVHAYFKINSVADHIDTVVRWVCRRQLSMV
jgi:hypothetical protein